ncbi:MAG TPA: Xaa-Pro peptidase family protein [Gammaproteobacteria bacterium]|nr:Xaa-Pro peptidase family protein [Gammaproteobacteria bacterium]
MTDRSVAQAINSHRLGQLTDLMSERRWDSVLLYAHGWRREFFRCLVNLKLSGPYAAASVTRSGDLTVFVSDPWDYELASASLPCPVQWPQDFARCFAESRPAAVAGLDFAEQRFLDACPAQPVSAMAEVEELRRVKTSEEIDCLRRAVALADRGYERFVEVIEPGMAEFELVAEVESFLKSNGAEDNFMLIASGGTEVVGMKAPTERRFRRGDAITTELTPQVDGYYAQICRTLVLGDPTPGQRQSFEIFSAAQQAAEDLIRPGVSAGDVARAENDVFRKHGYGEYTGPKYTRVRGHCLGLFPDETPHILEDVDYVLKEDMVLIAHPNTYLPLAGYMVFGDSLLVTAGGAKRLNTTEKKLFVK